MPAGAAGGPLDGDTAADKWTVGAAFGWFKTDIMLSHRDTADPNQLEERMAVISLSHPIGDGWSLTGLVGIIIEGTLTEQPRAPYQPDAVTLRNPTGYGGLVGVALSKTWIAETATTPFLSTTFKLAASFLPQVGDVQVGGGLLSVDIRGSVTVGKTFKNVFTPYLSARVFGGPIVWWRKGEVAVGTDRYHVQVAIGASLHIPVGSSRLTATVDWSPALERSFSAGLGLSF